MPLMWLLGSLLFSATFYANSVNNNTDLDSQSVAWLVSQIKLGEIQKNQLLMTDSLDKLLSVAGDNIQTYCAQGRVYFTLNQPAKARTMLTQLTGEQHPCVAQLTLLIRTNSEDKQQIQQARLFARAGQYQQAIKIYDALFPSLYPSIEYEFEHINWLANDDNNWQQALRGYQSLVKRFPDIGRFDITYARHILKQNPDDQSALAILKHYAYSAQYRDQAENSWLTTLADMPPNAKTDKAYQDYLTTYPQSSKGKLQYADFKKQLQAELIKQADPAYQAWQKGVIALEAEQYQKASRLLQQAKAGRPTDPDVITSLGILNLRQGEHAAAYQYFKKAQQYSHDIDRLSVLSGLANTARFWQFINETKTALDDNNLSTARLKIALADTLDEDPNTVNYYRGQIAEAAGDFRQAMTFYKATLKETPLNQQALTALLLLSNLDNNSQRVSQFFNSLSTEQQALIIADYKILQSQQLRQRADQLREQGQLDSAVELLLIAIKQTPRQSWLYYDLANLYQQQGLVDHARALYKKTLWQFPLDAELRYSHAIFLRALNDYQGALETLSFIPNNARTQSIETLTQQLTINAKINALTTRNDAQSKATIIYNLTELEAQPLTPLMQAELANQWWQINEQRYAIRQLSKALNSDPTLSPYWHMTYGQWLIDNNNKEQAKQWLATYQLPAQANTEQQARFLSLQIDYINNYNQGEQRLSKLVALAKQHPQSNTVITALINANLAMNRHRQAIELYRAHANHQPFDMDTRLAIANANYEINNYAVADKIVVQLVNDVTPEQSYQQQLLMATLSKFSDAANVIPLAQQLIVKSNSSQELYYQAAQVAQQHNYNEQAQRWYTLAIAPQHYRQRSVDPELNYQLYRINEDAPWYINNAKRALADIQQSEQAYITAGVNFSSQTSTQSESTLAAGSMPIEIGFPLWQGSAIVKFDPMRVASQQTRFDETFSGSRYGQGALCIFDCPLNSITPEQVGADIAFAWQNETWRFDLGTTPLGFLVEDITWGIDYNNSWGDFGYTLTLNKRPVTSSLLSYAGLEDVLTNEVWGGVRATSAKLNVSHDLGFDWGFWGAFDLQLLQGKNVRDNQRYGLMGGSYYRYIRNKNIELTLGTSLMHWTYQYNLSEETFGHGGYYSPQSYLGASLPITFDHRLGNNFVYRLRAGVSWSTTTTDDSEFFPNDPLLQAQALDRQTLTGVNPVFVGDTTSGVSYNLAGSFEYRFTPHWFFGGMFTLDRADFYEPNYGQLYFRYNFKPVYTELSFPARPVIPYADY
ncbi:cellulose synthase subunit BcsC-related outer membrane protein [Pseudoalteromonas mariniglutinosa]|uniref:cellulose synthase subunit BcsC-related outer membrane protein n=1 Tax=Pseudoalteromonas mariniglutinosa TaxID=206042 RepID=UPI0038517769